MKYFLYLLFLLLFIVLNSILTELVRYLLFHTT